jgi:hypothetical protein
MLPWGWIAMELITAQIGLMITDQSSGVSGVKFYLKTRLRLPFGLQGKLD